MEPMLDRLLGAPPTVVQRPPVPAPAAPQSLADLLGQPAQFGAVPTAPFGAQGPLSTLQPGAPINAQQIPEAGAPYGGRRPQPPIRQEGGSAPAGGPGVQPGGQGRQVAQPLGEGQGQVAPVVPVPGLFNGNVIGDEKLSTSEKAQFAASEIKKRIQERAKLVKTATISPNTGMKWERNARLSEKHRRLNELDKEIDALTTYALNLLPKYDREGNKIEYTKKQKKSLLEQGNLPGQGPIGQGPQPAGQGLEGQIGHAPAPAETLAPPSPQPPVELPTGLGSTGGGGTRGKGAE
jgi:hypothetical protein